MKKILVVSGHPNIDGDSVANKTILEELAKRLPEAEIDRLDALYPDYQIDVAKEQAKLVNADIIVLQYPVFWYSMPSLMHKWMEDVFAHGFSHGSKGKALVGKKLLLSMTIGAPIEHYGEHEAVHVDDLLVPAKGACAACGMEFAGYLPLFYVTYGRRINDAACQEISHEAAEHAAKVVELIKKL